VVAVAQELDPAGQEARLSNLEAANREDPVARDGAGLVQEGDSSWVVMVQPSGAHGHHLSIRFSDPTEDTAAVGSRDD